MGRPKKIQEDDFGISDEGEETFAESKGLPANAHAKKLAKAKSKASKDTYAAQTFYTLKDGKKVVKIVVKPWGTQTVYIGNMLRHKDGLTLMIAEWKKEGKWFEPHQVQDQIIALREG